MCSFVLLPVPFFCAFVMLVLVKIGCTQLIYALVEFACVFTELDSEHSLR